MVKKLILELEREVYFSNNGAAAVLNMAAGLDQLCTTNAEMDTLDLLFACRSCAARGPPKTKVGYPWKPASRREIVVMQLLHRPSGRTCGYECYIAPHRTIVSAPIAIPCSHLFFPDERISSLRTQSLEWSNIQIACTGSYPPQSRVIYSGIVNIVAILHDQCSPRLLFPRESTEKRRTTRRWSRCVLTRILSAATMSVLSS
ncbi:hypothetical protein BD779DRAFT_1171409 [Infundibulicybe gibba]|nr:hypothetical protein BD779DRAFT_1171409 [Infundibulicybe gibba]